MTNKDSQMAIGFVTYNPKQGFIDRLKLLSSSGYDVYVFDNTPEVRETKSHCDAFANVRYATAGNNVGLGVGLSVINATAYYDGCRMLVFFDQDTGLTLATLKYINEFIGSCWQVMLENYVAVVFDAQRTVNQSAHQLDNVLLAISSGSLFVLENLKKIGWHNPTYFVDGVDYELCLRARHKGYQIGKCSNTPGFDHETEQPDRMVEIFKKRLPVRRYSGGRVRDSMRAYLRLIAFSIKNIDLRAVTAISRSFLIFSLGQVLARTVLRKAG